MNTFIDDSGKDGKPNHVLMAGWIGRADCWLAWGDDWQAELDKNGLSTLHMCHAYSQNPKDTPWHSLHWKERTKRITGFAEVIAKHRFEGIVSTCQRDDIEQCLGVDPKHSHIAAMPILTQSILDMASSASLAAGHRDGNTVIIDVQSTQDETDDLQEIADGISDAIRLGLTRRRANLTVGFSNESDTMALQSADLLAWCQNRFNMKQKYRVSVDERQWHPVFDVFKQLQIESHFLPASYINQHRIPPRKRTI